MRTSTEDLMKGENSINETSSARMNIKIRECWVKTRADRQRDRGEQIDGLFPLPSP